MHVQDEITFKNEVPSMEKILQKVKELSGLSETVLFDRNGKFSIMAHPLFKEREFLIDQKENKIYLIRGWDDPNYLLEITVSSLISLGGVYKGELESWTNEKWEKVKDNYHEVLSASELDRLNIVDEIEFRNQVPSFEEIFKKVKEISGLTDMILIKQFGKSVMLEHPFFRKENHFLISQSKSNVNFMRASSDPNYLLEVTLSALIDLGGFYKGELEKWTNKKWEDVKQDFR